MEIKYKDMIKAFDVIEEEKHISEDVIKDALCEAMAKAYKKEAGLDDIDVYAQINEKKKTIDLFQRYTVTDDVEDDELEISLEDARQLDPQAQIGDKVSRPIEITGFSRASATLTRNVMRQKIREAEKVAVYDEYIDQLHEMVLGVVESVKDKFTLVNLGKTVAMMPRSQEIPQERLVEGQQIRVVITEVNKDTKGSQVLVSRADPMLVKRLFEKEVPEIYNGIVEIKAIARDAGERTKMAVMSHNPEVDPIGACIGPRGQRVQEIIEELKGEKIDIFQWSDDISELVKNALAPAEVEAVLPGDDNRSLIVVVAEDQLSLAIGKHGKNARLAVRLTDRKIDIKTRAELEEAGVDYEALLAKAEEKKEEYRREAARREAERMKEQAKADEEKRLAKVAELEARKANNPSEESAPMEEEGFIPEEMQEEINTDMILEPEEKPEEKAAEEKPVEAEQAAAPEENQAEEAKEEPAEEAEKEEEPVKEEAEPAVKAPARRKHADLEEMAEKNTYVSRFEKLTDMPSKPKYEQRPKHRKKKNDAEDNYKVDNKELEKQIKSRLASSAADNKPIYTEEELAEIEAQRQADEDRELGIDDEYDDEYDDYYDDEDK
ncbi:MAG: transcription termination factor NusA [Lactimicrobium sp.]|jgi:N utilization substance protein A|uniref:transcription termination factor NusA n=1 Tax=Lactimicrobium sp. TaxID=2563780 RepID=UPI002F3510E9